MDGFAGLFDDAAIFPPGNLPLPQAIPAHRAHREAWYGDLVGPFVLPAARLDQLAALSDDAPALSLILREPAEPIDEHWRVTSVELPPHLRDDLGQICEIWQVRPTSSVNVAVYAELSWAELPAAIDALPPGVRVKLRTGGTTAGAFPSESALAAAITACVRRGTPFKCTAGLHHAIRHTDPDTGFEQHGFLNVLLATAMAGDGGDVEAALAERDAPAVAKQLDADTLARARDAFTSFGTCSIAEPVRDLVDLGVVAAP